MKSISVLNLGALLVTSVTPLAISCPTAHHAAPIVDLSNGTYRGTYNQHYHQDLFLGMPYAQPPVGSLRFSSPKALDKAWKGHRDAKEFGWMCIGYGSDTQNLGSPVNEDCLTINIVRPSGVEAGDELPVGLWVHGGVSTHLAYYIYLL